MALSECQKKVFNDKARFRCVSAGRRWGKTYLSIWEMAKIARYPNKNIQYLAPTLKQGKRILWTTLKDELTKRHWVRKINESSLTILLVNGSTISIGTAQDPDNLRGVSLDFVVLDEYAFMKKDLFNSVLRPALSDREGSALFISTPQGYDNFYDLWLKGKTQVDWSSHQYTTIEGGFVTAKEVESAKSELPTRTFREEYEASFESSGNQIFYSFDINESVAEVSQLYNKLLSSESDGQQTSSLHIGLDFNVGQMSGVVAIKTKDGLHIIDELVLPNSHTQEVSEEIRNRYPNSQITIYPDPSGNARKTSALGKTDFTILRENGFTVKAPKGHDPVKDGINSTNRLLQDANGYRRMFIDKSCKETIGCLQRHQYKPGTSIPDKDAGDDHLTDSVRYLVNYLYPIRRAIDSNKIKTFGRF